MKLKEDRRVKYTKALLKDALVELMYDTHISKISVTTLCDMADVHRTTFYAHYTDQYDLLRKIKEEVIENIRQYLSEKKLVESVSVTEQNLIGILEYAKKNAKLAMALLRENGDDAFQKDIIELANWISLSQEIRADERTKEYISFFGVSGCIAILQKWLENGSEEPTAIIAQLILQLTQFGSNAYM